MNSERSGLKETRSTQEERVPLERTEKIDPISEGRRRIGSVLDKAEDSKDSTKSDTFPETTETMKARTSSERLRDVTREFEKREIQDRVGGVLDAYDADRSAIEKALPREVPETSDTLKGYDSKTATVEETEKTLEHHPHLHRKTKAWHYGEYEDYKAAVSETSEVSTAELAERLDIDASKVEDWREGRSIPTIPRRLESYEQARVEHESSVPSEALEHRIDPERVREIVGDLTERKEHTLKELSDLTEGIYRAGNVKEDSVAYAELYDPTKSLTEDRLRDIGLEIRANREAIEEELNKRLGLETNPQREVRVAVTDSRIYYWNKDGSADNWLNVLDKEKIYFKRTEDKFSLMEEMEKRLHIRGAKDNAEYYLNDVLNQLSHLNDTPANRTRRYSRPDYFDGETYHFVANLKGGTLEDLKPLMSHMGTKEAARVENLKFPDIHEYRMKFVAIAESDCHLDEYGRLSYYEKNPIRRRLAVKQFAEFGDFEVKEDQEDNKRVMLPRTLGALAEKFGIPRGDKAIHNHGLSEVIVKEDLNVKALYPREMVPEDGSVSIRGVSVTRHNVIHAGKHMKRYLEKFGIEPKVSQKHIDFICKHGEGRDAYLCYEKDEVVEITIKKIEELIKSQDKNESDFAKELYRIAEQNPNRLLEDEVLKIMKPLGVTMKTEIRGVLYYRKSERVSIYSTATTKTIKDTIRLLLIAPPNHPRKMESAIKIVKSKPKWVESVKSQMIIDGLDVHESWERYGI